MELTLNHLNEIHDLLQKSYKDAKSALKLIDFDVSPTDEKRELLNSLLEKMGGYLIEISHIDSFFQECDYRQIAMTKEQQTLALSCQQLSKQVQEASRKVISWVAENKQKFNSTLATIPFDEDDTGGFQTRAGVTEVTAKMMDLYQEIRDTLKSIHSEALFVDPENMMTTAGRRLKVLEGKNMFIETEHEMNVLIDYGLFQFRKNDRNIIQRYYEKHHTLYAGQKLQILKSFKDSRFSLLEILHPANEHGVIVRDQLVGEHYLLIDRGFHQLAKTKPGFALLTHYLQAPDFILTTGASVPVLLDSPVGRNMWAIFEQMIKHHQHVKLLESQSYLQCITDLYKMAIHEDLVKIITSRDLPFDYHALMPNKNRH